VAKATGAETARADRLVCGKDLSLPGHPEILVTGGLMCLDRLPGVAEAALQAGRYAGRRLSHEAQGEGYDEPFGYHDLGSAAYHLAGRAGDPGWQPSLRRGFLGWWVRLFIHTGFLAGYATASGRFWAGGSPSPVTCAANAPSLSTACQWRPARTVT
jgi:NADH:ubiquinone reductase (H+-translocating)